jgi:tripeptidyl-peptidase I
MFIPSFPPGCPYVTTVGATHQFESEFVVFRPGYLGADGNYQEIYSSGGRSSNYFKRLLYQEKVVSAHVQNLDGLYDGWYNRGTFPSPSMSLKLASADGRIYPDISAQG